MPEMAKSEKLMCRSAPWALLARKVILPWALQGHKPVGDGIEVGGGSGRMGTELLAAYPSLSLVVTDFDEAMLSAGREDLEAFGDRAEVRQADATQLPFEAERFDYVFSFMMLHHVGEWEEALRESLRVLRPGGWLIGYDLLETRFMKAFHRMEGTPVRMIQLATLQETIEKLPCDRTLLIRSRIGSLLRFRIRKELSPPVLRDGEGSIVA